MVYIIRHTIIYDYQITYDYMIGCYLLMLLLFVMVLLLLPIGVIVVGNGRGVIAMHFHGVTANDHSI